MHDIKEVVVLFLIETGKWRDIRNIPFVSLNLLRGKDDIKGITLVYLVPELIHGRQKNREPPS